MASAGLMHLAASAHAWGEGTASPRMPLLGLLAKSGYEGVEYPPRYEGHATQLEQAARRAGVRVVATQCPIPQDLAVDEAGAARVRHACLEVRQAGGTHLLFEPPRAPLEPAAIGAWLRSTQEWVRDAGIIPCVLTAPETPLVGIEQVRTCLAEAGRLVCLALDLAALRDGAGAEMAAANTRTLAYVRLTDRDAAGGEVALGGGVLGVAGLLDSLTQAGYMGWLAVRCKEEALVAARDFLEDLEVLARRANRYPKAAAR